MIQRACVAVIVGLMSVATLAVADDVSIELVVVPQIVNLGEPFDVLIRIVNERDDALITSDEALHGIRMWPYLELVHLDDEGVETPVAADRPMYSPSPSSLWAERDGEQVPVRPAVRLEPQHIEEVSLTNLLRYFPIADPGDYRLSIFYELPVFPEVFTSPELGDIELVALDEAEWLSIEVTEIAFSLVLSADITGADLAWFRDARMGMLGSGCGEDVVMVFSYPPIDAGDTIRACSLYWIGEAYQLFQLVDEASAAYAAVVDEYPDSLFAAYAQRRAADLAPGSSP